jgi:two-component system, OmpR family, heavy metal sensor histidine kinase CusS
VEGTGLGLSLALEIIRAHGGELNLEDSRDGLTPFTVRLPINA